MRISRPDESLPWCGGAGTCPSIAWKYKDSHNKRLWAGSPKLGVQVGVVDESQSISSWGRSPIAGREGHLLESNLPHSDCAAHTGCELPSYRFHSQGAGSIKSPSCPEIRWVELPFPLDEQKPQGSDQKALSLLVPLQPSGSREEGVSENTLKDGVATIEWLYSEAI